MTIWKGDFTFVVAGVPYVTTAEEAKALDDAIVRLFWDHLDVGYFAANDVADLIEVSYLSRLDGSSLARRPLELTVESEWIPGLLETLVEDLVADSPGLQALRDGLRSAAGPS